MTKERASLEEKALFELISSSDGQSAAFKTERVGEWIEWVLGIGNDDVVYITMPVESYEELIIRINNRMRRSE